MCATSAALDKAYANGRAAGRREERQAILRMFDKQEVGIGNLEEIEALWALEEKIRARGGRP